MLEGLGHVPPDQWVNILKFVLETIKFGTERHDRWKDKKAPKKVEEILTRAESDPKTLDARELERSIDNALEPEDAATIKGQLELVSLLLVPGPNMDAFDYWGKLEQLVRGL